MPEIIERPRTAKGVRTRGRGSGLLIACRFNDADFAAVKRRAEAHDRSFAGEVRALVKWALASAPKVRDHNA